MRSPIPPDPEWVNDFDIIHQRLLLWGLRASDWPTVLKNHYSLLKPGGWIQLVEGEWVDEDPAFEPQKYPNIAKLSQMIEWVTRKGGMDINTGYYLEDMLRKAGFVSISKTQIRLGYGAKARENSWKQRSAHLWAEEFGNMRSRFPIGGIDGIARDLVEFDAILSRLGPELLAYGYAPTLNFVIGQKPQPIQG